MKASRMHASWRFAGFLCAVVLVAPGEPTVPEQRLRDDVSVRELDRGVWIHVTEFDVPKFGRVPANGLVVIDGDSAVVIDLPWTDDQTGVLFDWIEKTEGVKKSVVVPTHSHMDCAGGLAEAHRRGADSLALAATADLLKKAEKPAPRRTYEGKTELECGNTRIELSHVGGGHTRDNTVAWIPSKKILFGGCLVKESAATNLGNTEEADLEQYPATLRKLKELYPDAVTVVPGHGKPGGLELIDHTLDLCAKNDTQPKQ